MRWYARDHEHASCPEHTIRELVQVTHQLASRTHCHTMCSHLRMNLFTARVSNCCVRSKWIDRNRSAASTRVGFHAGPGLHKHIHTQARALTDLSK